MANASSFTTNVDGLIQRPGRKRATDQVPRWGYVKPLGMTDATESASIQSDLVWSSKLARSHEQIAAGRTRSLQEYLEAAGEL